MGSTLQELFPDADDEHTDNIANLNNSTDTLGRHQVGDISSEEAADQSKNATVSTVKANTTDIETDRMYEWKDTAFIQLQAMAAKVTDPTAKSFLQLAANAA